MKTLFSGAALAALTCISLSACGGNSADPVAVQAKSSIAQQMVAEATDPANPLKDSATATCVATGVVDKVGVAQLKTYGLIDDKGNATSTKFNGVNASKADATALIDTLLSCAGADKVISQVRDSIMASEASASASVKSCLSSLLTQDTLRTFLIAEEQGKSSADATAVTKDLTEKLTACATKK